MSTPACPDNSTECLLRAILDADSGYNWDPVNFGFTAAFTTIAFIVSVIALFQNFIAAGPGRLKASERAIGSKQHEQRTDVQFSWKEFRFRTIVNVPVIDINKVLKFTKTITSIDRKNRELSLPPSNNLSDSRVVAGWSQLLNDLSLTDIEFDTIPCLTDYVPDDIPAAPAWGRVESIILLSIMKGCTRLTEDKETGFISANGASVQLSWNVHPTLGPMAFYRTWDIKETSMHSLCDVQEMVPIFLGELYLNGNLIFKPMPPRAQDVPIHFDFLQVKALSKDSWMRCEHQHDHCLNRKQELWSIYLSNKSREGGVDKETAALASALFADRPAKTKAFPLSVTKMHSALIKMYEEYFPWLILADDLDDHVLKTLCVNSFMEFDENEAKPYENILYQPRTLSWLPIASGFQPTQPTESQLPHRPTLNTFTSNEQYVSGKLSNGSGSNEKLQSSDLRIARPAVRYLSRWFSDESFFHNVGVPELMEIKRWLTYQLAELDWFLSLQGDDAICAASNLVAIGSVRYGVVQFTRISRRFVMPETLEAYNLDWTPDPENDGRMLVRGYLDKETVQRLYAHTRNYIDENRSSIHTVKCSRLAQGWYYAKKKPRLRPSATDPPERPDNDSSTFSSISPIKNRAATEPVMATVKDASVVNIDSLADMTTSSPESTTFIEYKPWLRSPDTDIDTKSRDWSSQDRKKSLGEDEIAVNIDPRIAALEALTFFRAGIYGALLAAGTDTSLVLMSDKRYQIVQLQ